MTLTICTARLAYSGFDRVDVTRKAGSPFAPSWALLRAAKAIPDKLAAWDFYVPRYQAEMRRSWRTHKSAWLELLARDRVVLCCYCAQPAVCHRSLLAGLLVKAGESQGVDVCLKGEIVAT